MSTSIQISGLGDVLNGLKNSPENIIKVTMKAAKAASSDTSKQIKANASYIPSSWKKLIKYKVKKGKDGKIYSTIGFYGTKEDPNNRSEVGSWFKAYWRNYGTLENRDPSHHFQNKVKHRATSAARRRRNKVGEKPMHFFESVINDWEKTYTKSFDQNLDKLGKEIWK